MMPRSESNESRTKGSMENNHDMTDWRPQWLVGTLIAVGMLAATWWLPGPWQNGWQWIDQSAFFSLNGMLGESQAMDGFWALLNSRAFDLLPVTIIVILLWRDLVIGGVGKSLFERVVSTGLMALYVLVAVSISMWVIEVERSSPSVTLEPSNRLSELVWWVSTTDTLSHSFPSIRATAVMMFCLFLCWGKGRWRVGWMAGLLVLAVLPRLVAGAHWISDVAVGPVVVALPVMAVLFATPLHGKLVAGLVTVMRRRLPWIEPLVQRWFDPEVPGTVGKGICMGTADIIPGVSGGTMAYILGIYERLLESITVFRPSWFRQLLGSDWRLSLAAIPYFFLLPLGLGIVLAMVIFTKVIPLPYFVAHHPEPVYGLFFGLVGGSVILLLFQHARLCLKHGVIILIGTAVGLTIVSLVPASTPDATWFIFLCGALAISAMILPGISGSFILLILGKYALILAAIGDLDWRVLSPFALGCMVGLLGFAHGLKWLMARFTTIMHLLIIGILIGTLRAVWPYQERIYTEVSGKSKLISTDPFWPSAEHWLELPSLLMLIGFGMIYGLHYLSREKPNKPTSLAG